MIDLRSARAVAGEVLGAVLARLAPAGTADPCPRHPECPGWCPCRINLDPELVQCIGCAAVGDEPCEGTCHAACCTEGGIADVLWRAGDPAPDCSRSTLGALDPLVGTPREVQA